MSSLTVAELVSMLSEVDDDLPVRFAHQPSYPFQLEIARRFAVRTDAAGTRCVYLLEAGQVDAAPYAPAGVLEGQLEDEEGEGCPAASPCPHPSDQHVFDVRVDADENVIHVAGCTAPACRCRSEWS